MSKKLDIVKKQELLKVEDLHMVYQSGKLESTALRGVGFRVKAGEFVAIMGPSGCGKSTLLHIIGGLLRPSSGRVLIDGFDMAQAKDGERTRVRRDKIGFVFQRFNLLPTLTARDNIELASRLHNNHFDIGKANELLRMLGLEDKMHHKPSELSGGEQQRVAIARAIINRPALLLADEPTGNLDSGNSRMVLEMLKHLNQEYKQTILMITHDHEAAASAGRILEMRDGKLLSRVQNLFYAMEQKLL
ncbi:MAG TPA: ABC transporter ATP-binding protein [Acidobacteriota bacterium]|nr:ABC transporter ATP-binding protein [Acidobacteriota bacterium]